MNRLDSPSRRRLPLALAATAALAGLPALFVSTAATADPAASPVAPVASGVTGAPGAEASPATAASLSASTSASASASGPPPLPALDARIAAGIPDTTSPAPAFSSWKTADKLAPEPRKAFSECDVQLQREWLHVRCRGSMVDVALVSGDAKGVALALVGEEFMQEADAVLPLRRGKSYVVSFTSAEFGRYGSGLPDTAALLWVLWPESQALPTVRLE